MRFLYFLILIFLFASIGCVQNVEVHTGRVIESYPQGDQEITLIYNEVTHCDIKTNPHTDRLFQSDELLQIIITEGNDFVEIFRVGLQERVTAKNICDYSNGSEKERNDGG